MMKPEKWLQAKADEVGTRLGRRVTMQEVFDALIASRESPSTGQKSKVIYVRCSPVEHRIIHRAATRRGVSITKYVKSAVIGLAQKRS